LKKLIPYLLLTVAFFYSEKGNAQINCTVPASPVLNHVTINHADESVTLNWAPSPSPDIAAYIIYEYNNDAGIAIDTISPAITSYTYSTPKINYSSVTYVVAAHRNPNCTSPLSNSLSTIFAKAQIDTCNNKLLIKWNKYIGEPIAVRSYAVMSSINGGGFAQIAELTSDNTEFILENFTINTQYSFFVEAKLEGGGNSKSNITSVLTKIQRPPDWINADYATIENNRIELSFTYDPNSEIKTFLLERRTGDNGNFTELAKINSSVNTIRYTDDKANLSIENSYRLSSVNNCGNPVVVSNEVTNIALAAEIITVPNVFTPNNDLINDRFKPVLSFIPSDYHLIITDRQGRILFETRNYDESWDGSYNGSPVRQDVYLWRLRVTTPSRSVINRTGTVTVYFNR
jgi:gliding motility-associated-like protein